MKTALLELAHSCETEEPHALLDAAIHAAVFGAMDLVDALPAYTTSLDAAVTLVPEGWRTVDIHQREPGGLIRVILISGAPRTSAVSASAMTEAMARAAALRARAEALP